jgi:hypothetical protein
LVHGGYQHSLAVLIIADVRALLVRVVIVVVVKTPEGRHGDGNGLHPPLWTVEELGPNAEKIGNNWSQMCKV